MPTERSERILSFGDWERLKARLDALSPDEMMIVASYEGIGAAHVIIGADALEKVSAALPGLNVEIVQTYRPA